MTMAGLQMSKTDIMKLKDRAERLKTQVKNASAKAEEVIKTGVRSVEITAGAFGCGLVQGKYATAEKAVEIFGIPFELATGIGMHVGGFMGLGGGMASHLHNFADGALAAYAANMGKGAGLAWKEKEANGGVLPAGAATKGISGAAVMSDAEIAQVVRNA